ncbi:restriction endonuclease subunit S [Flavobacterium sp. ACAM 123]|uniref:restriction endonuclease subunit S n=1 Tax=Flavobacterium sp. ACAM 123 TaxID=1189620 RepID=UPI00030FDB3A|nr:restriction endonuclease subunit S [Flavobacterium sp. ACAM 123]
MEKLLPQLRFPEFTSEWEEKSFKDIVKINQGLQIPISERLTDQIENSYFYITNEFLKANSEKKYFVKNPNQSVVCKKEDILMTRTGNTGMVVTNVEGVFHNNFFKVAYPEYIDKTYLYNFLKLDGTQNLIKKLAGTSTIPDLNHSDFYRIELQYPSLPEQTKIASFLTEVDKKLTALKQNKILLEQYKKGVMQQFFSQGLRFKDDDGNDFADWEEKKLGEVYNFKVTNSFSRENLNYDNGDVKNIHYGDIHTKFQSNFNISNEIVPYINPEISIQRISEDNYCKEGDLVFADASEDYADIGKCIEIINLNNERTLAGLHTLLARPDLSKISIGFGNRLMKSEKIRNHIMKIAQGSKVLSISIGRMSDLLLEFPSLPEQTKIANFLSAIDEKINHCQEQIDQTTIWKKGLLQQLFV